jgi:hypothetical protein
MQMWSYGDEVEIKWNVWNSKYLIAQCNLEMQIHVFPTCFQQIAAVVLHVSARLAIDEQVQTSL